MSSNNFSLRLDIIKILAIFLIVFYHLYASVIDFKNGSLMLRPIFPNPVDFLTQWGFSLAVYGYIGLSAFFIISGLGLSYSQSKKEKNFGEFIKTRFIRIFPLYWIILAITILTIWHYEPSRHIDTTSVITHILGVHTLFSAYMQDMNGPLWFIGAILQLYLLFPFMYFLLKRNLIGFFGSAIILKIIGMLMMQHIPGIGTVAAIYLPEFAIGMYIGRLWAQNPDFRINLRFGAVMSLLFVVMLFLLSTNKYVVIHGLWIINFDALSGICLFFTLDFLLQIAERFITWGNGKKEWLMREWAKGTFLIFMTHILFLNYYFMKEFLWWKPILAGNFFYAIIFIFLFYLIVSIVGYSIQIVYDKAIDKLLKKNN